MGQGQTSTATAASVFDPISIPEETETPREPVDRATLNPIVPWWQTNQPPNNLITGPQFGTDAIGNLAPGFNPLPPPIAGASPAGTPPALRWGQVTAHPFLSYGLTYGNGLLSGPGQQENTFINTVTPGISFDIGKYWNLSYVPSLVFFTADGYNNTVNQSVSLRGGTTAGEWGINLGNNFAKTDNPTIETGAQTQQTMNSTQFGASRPLTPVLSLDLGLSQALRWSDDFNNTFSWATQNGINYQLRRQLYVGANLTLGYDLVEPGTDMTSERFQLTAGGALGDKLSYNFSGGFEIRQFLDTEAEMKLSPILNASLNYALTEKTSFNVYANRQVTPSFFDNQFTESAALGGGVNQRIFGRYFLSFSGGYRWTENNSTFNPTEVVQTANFAFMRVGVSARFLRRGTGSVFYSWSNNDSSIQGLTFSSNQVGMQLSYGW